MGDTTNNLKTTDTQSTEPKQKGSKAKLTLIVAVVGALMFSARYFNATEKLKMALDWIEGLGFWGPVIFIALYVLATVFFLPGIILTLGAGLVFGVVKGSIYVSLGSIIGASVAFLIGRYLARDWVSSKIASNEKFKAVDEAVGSQGWKIVGLTRLSPVFPFNLLNYGFGVTKVSFVHYFFASWIGMVPGTIMYVYLGSLGKAATDEKSPAEWAVFVVGLLVAVGVTIFVTKIAKKALNKKIS